MESLKKTLGNYRDQFERSLKIGDDFTAAEAAHIKCLFSDRLCMEYHIPALANIICPNDIDKLDDLIPDFGVSTIHKISISNDGKKKSLMSLPFTQDVRSGISDRNQRLPDTEFYSPWQAALVDDNLDVKGILGLHFQLSREESRTVISNRFSKITDSLQSGDLIKIDWSIKATPQANSYIRDLYSTRNAVKFRDILGDEFKNRYRAFISLNEVAKILTDSTTKKKAIAESRTIEELEHEVDDFVLLIRKKYPFRKAWPLLRSIYYAKNFLDISQYRLCLSEDGEELLLYTGRNSNEVTHDTGLKTLMGYEDLIVNNEEE